MAWHAEAAVGSYPEAKVALEVEEDSSVPGWASIAAEEVEGSCLRVLASPRLAAEGRIEFGSREER